MALARSVQSGLLPSRNLPRNELDFAGKCVPAWQVGGDLYDVFEAPQGRVALVLGDVSGKGLPASLLMALIHGAVRSNDWTRSRSAHEEATERLNRLLCEKTEQERFASFFWGYYDADEAALCYINAGHLLPLLIRRTSQRGFDVQRLYEGRMVLGVLPDERYHQGRAVMEPGDLFVIFSDGITEATNGKQEEFGEERLIETIKENWKISSAGIRDAILVEVLDQAGPSHVEHRSHGDERAEAYTLLKAPIQNGRA